MLNDPKKNLQLKLWTTTIGAEKKQTSKVLMTKSDQ